MELRSLEGLNGADNLANDTGYRSKCGIGCLEGVSDMVLSTIDPATGNTVAFDSDGNMYSFNPFNGMAEMLLATMLPEQGIRRIVRRADGRTEGIGPDGSIYRFTEQEMQGLGFLRRLGNWVKEKADQVGDTKVGSVLRTVATPILAPAMVAQSLLKGESLKQSINDSMSRVKEDVRATGDLFGQVIRFVNRYINPATILLRNGWLICMKINLFGVAGTLRWAYAPDYAYVKTRTGMSEAEWNKTKNEAKRIETIYWQFGGIEENLKKAILSGKGNRDNAVPRGDVQITTANDADEAQKFISEFDDAGNLISTPGVVNADGTVTSAQSAVQAVQSQVQAVQAQPAASPVRTVTGGMLTSRFGPSSLTDRLRAGGLRGTGNDGLGEPVSTAAVATVSGAVAAVAAFLKPITELIQKGKNAVADAKDTVSSLLPKRQSDIPEIAPIAPRNATALTTNVSTAATTGGATTGGAAAGAVAKKDEKEPFYKGTPFLVGAGVLAAGGIVAAVMHSSRNDRQPGGNRQSGGNRPVNGLSGYKAARKQKPKKARKISGLNAVELS